MGRLQPEQLGRQAFVHLDRGHSDWREVLQFEFRMSNYIEPFGTWYTGTHVGEVTFNCLQLDLQLDAKGEAVEEDPGVYIN